MRQVIGPYSRNSANGDSNIVNTNFIDDITFQFVGTGITSGNGVLTVLGSNDGTNYTAISFLDPTQANTNAQNPVRLTSLTLSANGSKIGAIENVWKFEFIKFNLAWTTDGAYSVFVHADKHSS